MSDSLCHLLYTSVASEPFGREGLVELLDQSRRFNAEHGITGLLLYHNDAFMQLLEGPPGPVHELYHGHITRDRRHRCVELIVEEPAGVRLFPDWSMGFRLPVRDALPLPEGFSRVFEGGALGALADREPHVILRVLAGFRDEPSLF